MNNKQVSAKEILNSKGDKTIEVELKSDLGNFFASVPSGVSTGSHEAFELRDKDGGVKAAIENIKEIESFLKENNFSGQKELDDALVKLDGTKNKSRLGANAVLSVSIAFCRYFAAANIIPLYRYISDLAGVEISKMPKPSFNIIEGGKHAENSLAFQEFMIIPQKKSFKDNLKIGKAVYYKLKEILESKYGKVNLSKEGAFAAPIKEIQQALDLILEAARKAGYERDIKFAIDAAASEFFKNDEYELGPSIFSRKKLENYYIKLASGYPIASIEDPFYEEDWRGFSDLKWKVLDNFIIFGDDLTTTNIDRMKIAHKKDACSGLILKPNQIGTVSEAVEAAKLAKSFGWKIMVSNRAGETEDSFIADLATGIGAEFIKSGAPFPKERMAKYDRLVKIEEETGASGN
jgi:enolase